MTNLTFHRKDLAKAYCDSLSGKGIIDASSGLFLGGPRRVGKSTFILQDLIPIAKERTWLTIYIDLWSNRSMDPGLLIIEAIKNSIITHQTKLNALSKKVQVKKITLLNLLELDLVTPGLPDNITMTELLHYLMDQVNQPIMLVIDEGQHALSSAEGINTMYALKSARDQLNIPEQTTKFMLVLTGSNRDKLAQLVMKKDQPFFGSVITNFPLLGRDFTDYFTNAINKALITDNQFDPESMWEAFKLMGYRPEILREIVGQIALSNEASSFSALLAKNASIWQQKIWQEFDNDVQVLSQLQLAILELMITSGKNWSPFTDDSLMFYQNKTKLTKLSISSVQHAIDGLRHKGIIWQSSRGRYALEDESFGNYLLQHIKYNR